MFAAATRNPAGLRSQFVSFEPYGDLNPELRGHSENLTICLVQTLVILICWISSKGRLLRQYIFKP